MMQTDQNSEPSTTRYFKDKVRYQMTKKSGEQSMQAKLSIMITENAMKNIVHNNQDILGNLTSHYRYTKFRVTKFGTDIRVTQEVPKSTIFPILHVNNFFTRQPS